MALKFVFDSQDQIPEGLETHYTEVDGKWQLQVEGGATPADLDKVNTTLASERSAHAETTGKLKAYTRVASDPEDLATQLAAGKEAIAKLEAGGGDSFDQAKFDEAVNAKLGVEIGPRDRKIEELTEKLSNSEGQVTDLGGQIRRRDMSGILRTGLEKAGVMPGLIDDIVDITIAKDIFELRDDGRMLTRAPNGTFSELNPAPGMDVDQWTTSMRSVRGDSWWAKSRSAGAEGGDGEAGGLMNDNPWRSGDHWNLTAQGRQINQDRGRAEMMAKAAGAPLTGAVRHPKDAQPPQRQSA